MSREEYLGEPCSRCGAARGSLCVDKNGKELPPSLSHKARKDAFEHLLEIEANNSNFDKTVEESKEIARKEMRQDKIERVLFAIKFGREIMHMSQKQLDQRLAEMMVDGGHDLIV
jgi:hypothetical protein